MSVVHVVSEGPVTRITLNRPDNLNAFNPELVSAAKDALSAAEADGTRLVVFDAAGKGFSGGFDLSDIDSATDDDLLSRFVQIEELLQAVYYARCATLATVHGPCYGAAADLVVACNWRIASPEARFRMPGSRFGIILGTGRLARIVGADTARSLLLRDKPFGAAEALEAGFLTGIAERTDWAATEGDILGRVSALDGDTYASLIARMRDDARDTDMSALVDSVARGSIKMRLQRYLESIATARKPR